MRNECATPDRKYVVIHLTGITVSHLDARNSLTALETAINLALDLNLKTLVQILEHSRASRQHNVLDTTSHHNQYSGSATR